MSLRKNLRCCLNERLVDDVLIGRQCFADAPLSAAVRSARVPMSPPHTVEDAGHLIESVAFVRFVVDEH